MKIEGTWIYFFSDVFSPVAVLGSWGPKLLLKTQKSRRAEKNYNNSRSLQENFAHSAASQSTRTILTIQYEKSFVQPLPAVMIHVMTI